MKKYRLTILIVIALVFTMLLSACGMSDRGGYYYPNISGNEFHEIIENPFVSTEENNLSHFSLDTNTASYTQLRKYIQNGYSIDKNMVRTEEMLNYFNYDFDRPDNDNEALKISGFVTDCPWNGESKLLTVGVTSKDIERSEIRNNLVFLLDVSGSMYESDKLPLLQSAFTMLTESLNDDDIVSIVTYAGRSAVLLDGARGGERGKIEAVISDLSAGGSTAGAKGITRAYELAEKHFIDDGNNRVILATDGDFNVGVSDTKALEELIETKRDTGVYLTVMGFGYGNIKDNKMQSLAAKGQGNHFYIDTVTEARRALVSSVNGVLVTVARDTKAQIEFNKTSVHSYRLLGYENQLLTQEDWDNEDADAGEVGAGLCMVVVYEIKLHENAVSNFATASIKHKSRDTKDNTTYTTELEIDHSHVHTQTPPDIAFITAVVEFALILRNSEYKGDSSLDAIITRLESLDLTGDEYKTEFLGLVKKYKSRFETASPSVWR